jgi:hypothetical protein
VGFDEIANERVELDDVWTYVKEVAAGDAAGMFLDGVWGISEKARGGDSEVYSMFNVGKRLDMCRDEGHVYASYVISGCGEERFKGFRKAVVGWSQFGWERASEGVP